MNEEKVHFHQESGMKSPKGHDESRLDPEGKEKWWRIWVKITSSGGKLHDTGFGNDFLNMIPNAQATKQKIDELDYIKI